MKLACLNKKKAIFAVIVIILGCMFVFKGRTTLITENKERFFEKLITSDVKGIKVETDGSFFPASLKDEKFFTLADASEAKVFITNHNPKEVYVNLAMKIFESYKGDIRLTYQFNNGPTKNMEVVDWEDYSSFENSNDWVTLWNLELKPGKNIILFNLFLKEGEAFIYPPVDEDLRLKVFVGGIKVLPIGGLPWKQNKLKNKPNVLFVLIDNVQPNHLSCYGYFRNTSPNLNALAQEGVIFKQMITNGTWTRPSMSVMLTSRYCFPFLSHPDSEHVPPSLDKVLNDAGYQTFAIVSNPNVIEQFNIGKFFQSCYKADYPAEGSSCDVLAKEAIKWININKGNKFYMYIHFMDAHTPFNVTNGYFLNKEINLDFLEKFRAEQDPYTNIDQLNAYDSAIHKIDEAIGEIIKTLKECEIYKETLIIIVSDHGKYFETDKLIDSKLRITYLMSLPGTLKPRVCMDGLFPAVDIMPAIVDIIEVDFKGELDGRSFANLIEKKSFLNICRKDYRQSTVREAYVYDNLKDSLGFLPSVSLRTEQFLLTYYYEHESFEMYDLKADPQQKINLINLSPNEFASLKKKLLLWMEKQYKNAEGKEETSLDDLPDEKIKALRSLGYMQ